MPIQRENLRQQSLHQACVVTQSSSQNQEQAARVETVPGSAAGQRLNYELRVLAFCLWLSLSTPSEEQDTRRSRLEALH